MNLSSENEKYAKNIGIICGVCFSLSKKPHRVICCDKIFCKECIIDCLKYSPNCPSCRNENCVHSFDRFAQGVIDEIGVECKDCLEEIKCGEMSKHKCTSPCEFCGSLVTSKSLEYHYEFSCIYKCKNCQTFILHGLSNSHKTECIGRMVPCEFCQKEVCYSDLNHHHEFECDKKEVECVYCKGSIVKKLLYDHILSSCLEYSLECKCGAYFKRKEEANHLQNCEYGYMTCKCGIEIMKKDLIKHKETCKEELEECVYCKEQIKRWRMTQHINLYCGNILLYCPYKKYGCNEKILRKDKTNHIIDKCIDHARLIEINDDLCINKKSFIVSYPNSYFK